MTLHLGIPHAHRRDGEQLSEIKEARRLLRESIRDDWDYPPLPAFQVPIRKRQNQDGDVERRIAGFKFHNPSDHERGALATGISTVLDFKPLEWRERAYSTEVLSETESVITTGSHGSMGSTYRFEGPDSVGAQISDRKLARKRKRQLALDEEVIWNDGLAHWIARRDAWCVAHTSQQIQMLSSRAVEHVDSTSASANSSPRTSTSSGSGHSLAPASSPSTTPELVSETSKAPETPQSPEFVETRPPAPPSESLVPLAPPILANHPVRRRITPDVYPEIYTKIIIHGRAPSVPINLLVLTQALVQGWKDDGEWPPKVGPLEKSIGRKKAGGQESTLRHGVRAVGRVLRITGGESSVGGREKEKG